MTTKAESTRERILGAAAAELSIRGYAGARLTHIAARADLQPPTVYYHFKSREDLVAAVMTSGQQRLLEHVVEALDRLGAGASPLQRIEAAVEAHLHCCLELSDFASAVARNAGQLPGALRDQQRAGGRRYLTLWHELLADAAAANQINPALNLGAAAMFVIGALNWSPEWWDPSRGRLEDVIRTAQTLVRNGLDRTESHA